MVWPYIANEDRLFWCGNKFGTFTVSNFFTINVHYAVAASSLWPLEI